MTYPQPTLVSTILPAEGRERSIRLGAVALLGTLALTASAKIAVPFWPVPMTMQLFVVLVIGATLGFRLGAATVLLYLLEGAIGLPVFAGTPARGIGVGYMVGPTGGYLVGFVLAAAAVGFFTERGWGGRLATALAANLIGVMLVYIPGVLWLGLSIGFDRALAAGVLPFLPGDGLKVLLATIGLRSVTELVARPERS